MSYILKAVAHPIRIAIIDLLLQSDNLSVTDIYNKLSIHQPEASRQLNILKNAGLIDLKKTGTSRFYFIVDKDISRLLNCIENCTI